MKMKTRQAIERKQNEAELARIVEARKADAERRLFTGGSNPSGKYNPWARGKLIDYDHIWSDPND